MSSSSAFPLSVSPHALHFSEMLDLQSEVAFPFERPLFETPAFLNAQSVLDFGCGSAHYLKRLAATFPGKQYWAFDNDADMLQIARNNLGDQAGVSVLDHSGLEGLPSHSVSVILFRLVLMHLPDRRIAYEMARRLLAPDGCIIVVDADDSLFQMRPPAPEFLNHLSIWRATHPDRQLMNKLPGEMAEMGFIHKGHLHMTVNNSFPHARVPLSKYLLLNAEMMGCPVSVEEELRDWSNRPDAYLQQGVFGQVYMFE